MCHPGLLAALGTGGATAAGATAAATTLSTVGTIVSVGGSVLSAVSAYQTGKANVELIEQQMEDEAKLTAIRDHRETQKFSSAIAQQRAELASRGVQLDSATAVFLGQTAAKEAAFNSQQIRAGGQSRQQELSAEKHNAKAKRFSGLLKGGFSAAGQLLTSAEDQWLELTP